MSTNHGKVGLHRSTCSGRDDQENRAGAHQRANATCQRKIKPGLSQRFDDERRVDVVSATYGVGGKHPQTTELHSGKTRSTR